MSASEGPDQSFAAKQREMTGPYRAKNPLLVGGLYTADTIARFLPKRRRTNPNAQSLRVLVANWGHLGDVVTILPILKLLEKDPRVKELGVLIGSWSRGVLASSNVKANIHTIDHWALDRGPKSNIKKLATYLVKREAFVQEIRSFQYDVSIDTFVTFPSTHGIMWSAAIPRRIGYTSGGLGPCLTDPFKWTPDDRTMLEHQLDLFRFLHGDGGPRMLRASYPGFDSPAPKQVLDLRNPYVVVHMGGQQDAKNWMPEKWRSLVGALKDKGFRCVATGGGGKEAEAARSLSESTSILNLAGQLSWNEFVATVASAKAVVTIDSVTGHIAACFGVPVVVLTTGRTHLNLWRPNDPRAKVLMHPVACAPCFRTGGCEAMACVRHIKVEDVLQSLDSLLDGELPVNSRNGSVSAGAH